MWYLVAVLFLAVVGLSEQVSVAGHAAPLEWVKPAFCSDLDCPRFQVVSTNKDYEVRRYEKSMWVTFTSVGMDYAESGSIGFRKCFSYIQGANERGETIKMTAPVLRKVAPDGQDGMEGNMSTSFFVPYKNQPTVPKPTDPDLYIQTLPEITVYIRSFSGYAKDEQRLEELMKLADAIGNSAIYKHTYFYYAGYDGPYKWWDRHNEVWLEKQ